MLDSANQGALSQPEHPMTETMAARSLEPAFFTREEAARVLGVAPLTLSRWVAARRIGVYRVARRLRFARKHLREFLDRHEVEARGS